MSVKKIVFFTSNRADFGLQVKMINLASLSKKLDCELVVTGSHLVETYGSTIDEIITSTDINIRKIPIKLDSDNISSVGASMSELTSKMAILLEEMNPDIMVLLGDRYEIVPVGLMALLKGIKIAHIHGGESTFGAIDDSIRDAITSFATIHFAATEEYVNRIKKITKCHEHIYNVGGMGVDIIKSTKLMSKNELEDALGINFMDKNLLITFHPETLADDLGVGIFNQLLQAIERLSNVMIIFTAPNFDQGGGSILELINNYCASNSSAHIFKSLGIRNYISCLKNVDIVIGNSSSGLLEAPSLRVPTINIGRRQEGRVSAKSVINCCGEASELYKLIVAILNGQKTFNQKDYENPYGMGGSSEKIVKILEKIKIE